MAMLTGKVSFWELLNLSHKMLLYICCEISLKDFELFILNSFKNQQNLFWTFWIIAIQ